MKDKKSNICVIGVPHDRTNMFEYIKPNILSETPEEMIIDTPNANAVRNFIKAYNIKDFDIENYYDMNKWTFENICQFMILKYNIKTNVGKILAPIGNGKTAVYTSEGKSIHINKKYDTE